MELYIVSRYQKVFNFICVTWYVTLLHQLFKEKADFFK